MQRGPDPPEPPQPTGGANRQQQPSARGGQGGQTLKVITESLPVATDGRGQMIDLTSEIGRIISKHKMTSGTVTIFVPGSTASITTIEFEPGLKKDFPEAMERIAPSGARYHHDDTWHDGNGHSHIRSAVVGPSLTVPFAQGRLLTGTWQQVVLVDWDNRGRRREVIVQLMGVSSG
ncbi:MAG TPA: YjbQ family protein [Bacteroidetes bacterium]|nr:YjbQ family protein [Bacteroidota bacterium]